MKAMDDTALLREYAPRHSEPAFETLVARHPGPALRLDHGRLTEHE